jgi:hypothetical protein
MFDQVEKDMSTDPKRKVIADLLANLRKLGIDTDGVSADESEKEPDIAIEEDLGDMEDMESPEEEIEEAAELPEEEMEEPAAEPEEEIEEQAAGLEEKPDFGSDFAALLGKGKGGLAGSDKIGGMLGGGAAEEKPMPGKKKRPF